jgi:hypothetical protein
VEKAASDKATITGTGHEQPPSPSLPAPTTFANVIRQHQLTKEGWSLKVVHGANSNLDSLVHALPNNALCIVSDGSYKNGISTAACILTYPGSRRTLNVRCHIPGEAQFQDSYRGELGGIFAAIIITELLRKFSGIATATVEIGCDGKEALRNAFESCTLHPGQ